MIFDFKALPVDIQVYILTFCSIQELSQFSKVGKHSAYLVLSNDTDGYLWREYAARLCIDDQVDVSEFYYASPYLTKTLKPSVSVTSKSGASTTSKTVETKSTSSGNPLKFVKKWISSLFLKPKPIAQSVDSCSSSDQSSSTVEPTCETPAIQNREEEEAPKEQIVESVSEQCQNSDENEVTQDNDAAIQPEEVNVVRVDDLVRQESPDLCVWRKRVLMKYGFKWDVTSVQPDTTLVFSNNNRTVSNDRASKWDTLCVDTVLSKGHIHTWEYLLEEYEGAASQNSYRLFVGIEKASFPFNQQGFDVIIGYNSTGIGYNLGMLTLHRNNSHDVSTQAFHEVNTEKSFVQGDRITLQLDLRGESGLLHFFKNGAWFLTVDDISTEETWRPAMSIICKQTVTISRSTAYTNLVI